MPNTAVYLAQETHVAVLEYPVSFVGGITTAGFSMKNYSHVSIIVAFGVEVNAGSITVEEMTAQGGGGTNTPISFDVYKAESADTDVLGVRVNGSSVTKSTNNDVFYVIEIDSTQLDAGYSWLRVKCSSAGAQLGCIVAILSGARLEGDQSPTVFA